MLSAPLPADLTLSQVCQKIRETLTAEPEIERLHIYLANFEFLKSWLITEMKPEEDPASRPFWIGSIGRIRAEPEK